MIGITEFIGLICTWKSETFSYVPSPLVKKPCYLNHSIFLAWIETSSEPEITAQAVGARKRKQKEDFTGIKGDDSKFAACKCSSMLYFISTEIYPQR